MTPVLMSPNGYPLPAAEEDRLAEVLAFGLMDGPAAASLDAVCALARNLFDAPIALVDAVGRDEVSILASDGAKVVPQRRVASFCAWTIAGDEVLVVEDATQDPRFARNPIVAAEDGVRFYAGAPLLLRSGVALGALCVIDTQPRTFGKDEIKRLKMLAAMAVTEIRNRRELTELTRRESLVAQAAHLTKVGSWSYDPAVALMAWSDETARIAGLPSSASPALSTLLDSFVDLEARAWLQQAFRDLAAGSGPVDREIQIRGPRHLEPRWVRCLAEAERKEGAPVRIVGSFQDVTDRREAEARIERLAYRDALTGLPNRTLFQQTVTSTIEGAARRGAKMGLVLIDLDHFKDVNETLGHTAGDAMLRAVSERLSRAYRKTDMVARLGGDEFAVILPNIHGPADLMLPARKVMDLLRQPLEFEGRSLSVTPSVGAALYPDGADDGDQLLKNAEIALFQAKAAGRNRIVVYEPEMRAAVEQRIELLREVRAGLARGEFVLYYQPVVEIGEGGALGAVTGFEALTRWKHPTRGVVTPEHFMAAFEDPELSLQLGEATLENALRQMRAWIDEGVEFGRVAVNVSTAQFRTGRLAEAIADKLAFWRIPPERLCIEVTETVYMGWGAEGVGEAVTALHAMGVQIALDDFGTGYASLTHLKSFPIDRLKIDRSFVGAEEDRVIVRAVATLGASMGMAVVAEGVENEGQLAFLADAGCGMAQGFHIGRPMPAEAVVGYLAGRDRRGPPARLRLA